MNALRRLSTLALVGVVLCLVNFGTHARSWFVDNTATGTATGVDWTNAFTHFSQLFAANTGPDDVVYISGGRTNQTYGGYLRLSHNGTSGHPITITRGVDTNHNGVVIFDGADGSETFSYCDMSGRQYITIDGGSVDGIQGFAFVNLYDTTDRTMANKIFADGSLGLVVKYSGFTNVNNGIRLQSATQFYVGNCNFEDIRGDAAIRAVGCGPDMFDSNFIEFNHIDLALCTNCPALVYGPDGVQGSHGMTFRYNFVTCKPVGYYTSTQHPDFLQWTGNHNKAYGNLFLNPGDSCIDLDCFANATPNNWWIYNNIFQVATNCGALLGALSPNPWFFRTYSSQGAVSSYTNMKIWNNLFLDNSGWNSIAFTWNGTPTLSGMEIRNNIFMNSAPYFISGTNPHYSASAMGYGTNIYAVGSGWLIQGSTFTTNNWGTQEASAIFSAPTFSSYSPSCLTNDMHLSSLDTVAIGHGATLSNFFTIDKDQLTRTIPWTIGPYKAGYTPPSPPSNTPTNIIPVNAATNQLLNPTLCATTFFDAGGLRQADSQFVIYSDDQVTVVADSGTGNLGAVTCWMAPAIPANGTYYWNCRYQNSAGVWTAFSSKTYFVTAPTNTSRASIRAIVTKTGQITFP